jgi:hypothetical protein
MYLVYSVNNGLSDHDAQLITIKNIGLSIHKHKIAPISTTRIFNNQSLLNFQMQLSYETRDNLFSGTDVDTIFNSF